MGGLVKGYDSTLEIQIVGPVEIPSTATFSAQIRAEQCSTDALATKVSGSGISWISSVEDSANNTWTTTLRIQFGTETVDWPDKVVTDVVRTDPDPDEYLGFVMELTFSNPVTRGLP